MAHSNTIFHQLLDLLNRHDFRQIEKNGFRPKRKYRILDRWSQFVVMMFAQITGRASLRDIVQHFQFNGAKLYHLGVNGVKRTTLADANNKRPAEFFEALFSHQYAKCALYAPRKKFRFKNKLYSFDATVIDLCFSLFPWAAFRTTKGGIKVHTLLDHDGYIPAFIKITTAKVADITVAKLLRLPALSIVVMDRAYLDFTWLHKLTGKKVLFVTRLKRGINYRVVKRHRVIKAKGLTSDQTIQFTGAKAKDCPIQLRRIGYRDPETGQHYVFVTNIFHLSARTIADIYRERWQVGVSSEGHITQSVRVRPGIRDSTPVAWEVPWRESKMVKPSDELFLEGMTQRFRPQRAVNADVASLHGIPVAEPVYHVRRQQGPTETSPIRRLSPAGYQRWHEAKGYVSTGEALGVRRRNLVEEADSITVSGKWIRRRQGGGLGRSTDDRCAAKHTGRKGPRPVNIPFVCSEAGVR